MKKTEEIDTEKIRKDFPILQKKINGKPLVYLDNAATSQKPISVINSLNEYYKNYNANIYRAVHRLSVMATEKYDETRKKTADFIGAGSPEEIIFTKNTTESINLVAHSIGLRKGDEVIITVMEHHSNMVPWQMLRSRGVKINFVDINGDGKLRMKQFSEFISKRTKMVAVTQASNVLGTINDVKKIAKIAHDFGSLILVDGAQSVPHMPVNVHYLDVDFLAFSSHKMLGPMGVGVLYGKKTILNSMQPFLLGSDMIKEVTTDHVIFNEAPSKFEAGTPNVGDVIAFGSALDYLSSIGMKNIRRHEVNLTNYALKKMTKMKNLKIYGPKKANEKSGVISFNLEGVHPHDVSSILDSYGIAVRSGHSCAMPLMRRLGCDTATRASFYIYNTQEEIDKFIDGLEEVKKIFEL